MLSKLTLIFWEVFPAFLSDEALTFLEKHVKLCIRFGKEFTIFIKILLRFYEGVASAAAAQQVNISAKAWLALICETHVGRRAIHGGSIRFCSQVWLVHIWVFYFYGGNRNGMELCILL